MENYASEHVNKTTVFAKKHARYKDMCLSKEYIQLYEEKENGEAETFHFVSAYGEIEHTYIKRKIPVKIAGETYYDITSAYGYGGPIIKHVNDPEKLFQAYNTAFTKKCLSNKIVSAFYRFHILENKLAMTYFDGEVEYIRPIVARDLTVPINKNMHKSVRNSVKHARKKGLSVRFDTSEEALTEFLNVYNSTMQRNGATEYYYFEPSFFHDLRKSLKGHFVFSQAVLDGQVISTFITLLGSKHAFGFLGGTLSDYLSYNASTFLEFETIQWLKDKGLHYYILGGGLDGEDNLFRFKKKFDKEGVYPFYVGKKIYNNDIYNQLVERMGHDKDSLSEETYFPIYRK